MDHRQVAALTFLLAFLPFFVASSSCPFSSADEEGHHHDHGHHDPKHSMSHVHDDHAHSNSHGHQAHSQDSHDHDDDHDHSHHDCRHHHHHHHSSHEQLHSQHGNVHRPTEEIAEEEELKLYGFKPQAYWDERPHPADASPLGLWFRALGCSLLVSMASLICLILLPFIVAHGKPSRVVVDFLAAFGAGAMLGDAFLHQLPHALGNASGHSHSHSAEHGHLHTHDHHSHMHEGWSNSDGHVHAAGGTHGHAHSIEDLSVGLAVLAGIILFFIVEKIVRQVEKLSSHSNVPWLHHHHHHHHQHHRDTQLLEENGEPSKSNKQNSQAEKDKDSDAEGEDNRVSEKDTGSTSDGEQSKSQDNLQLRRRKTEENADEGKIALLTKEDGLHIKPGSALNTTPNLVLGYLNLFSDGVHNFTDGMALGSAFLNHGMIGGWSRTLFLLAHELPQEVGDFGILVQSGFSVLEALAFNFLSALVALAGTTMALLLGGNPGHSSLIEGFTAGGFIYIAVAGVLPEMHQFGTSAKTTTLQLVALGLGISVALFISLIE